MLKRFCCTVLIVAMLMSLCACGADTPLTQENSLPSVSDDADGSHYMPDLSSAISVRLKDNGSSADGDGVLIDGNIITVTKAGCYVFSGNLSNGQLRVETTDNAAVTLVLSGVTVHNDCTAPLFVRKAENVLLTLADGTQNTFSDGADRVYEDEENQEPSGTIFSKSDLVLGGEGTLCVNAAFADGIVSRDGLTVESGNITVRAADDALMGRDYVRVIDGVLNLEAAGDGIKSTNDTDHTVGFVAIDGGRLTVTSGKDGIQSQSTLSVDGGEINVVAGGGYRNGTPHGQGGFGYTATAQTESLGKGLKAGTVLSLSGGKVSVDAADDALHSNQSFMMSGGDVTVAAGDDGAHADTELTVANGNLTVTNSYEGLESATVIIEGGNVSVTASDDGVNASSGNNETGDDRGMPQNPFMSDDSAFYIRGGTVCINAQGDGLDSNGIVDMTGGDVIVIGPESNGNGTFDFGASFSVSGGKLVAIGSNGMASAPTSNTMNSIQWGGFSMNCGDQLTVTDSDGNVIAEVSALRNTSWMYVTCEELVTGEEVAVTCGSASQSFIIKEGGNIEGAVGGFGGPGGGGHPPDGFGGRPARPW